jgi:hypothetical protein
MFIKVNLILIIMGKLYVIATDHGDKVHGPRKLLSLYDQIRPDVLLSEMNEIDLGKFNNLCCKITNELRQLTPDQKGVSDFMKLFETSLGFEYYTNEQYAREHSIPNHMIDMPGGQSELYGQLEQSLEMVLKKARSSGGLDIRRWIEKFQGLQNTSPEELKQKWEMFSGLEGTLKGEGVLLIARAMTGRIGKQDKYMERQIRAASELHGSDKVMAYPVGMLHALKSISKSTLYSRIQYLNPERIPLL